MFLGGSKKDKGFSSKNKVQRYHGDGTETIILMGRPFRVLQRLEATTVSAYTTSGSSSSSSKKKKYTDGKNAYVYLVENTCRMAEFPRHLALKRSFFPVDQVTEAHKEISILEHVKDKNIVRVFHSEISRSEGTLGVSIAMEYCGNNLYRRIRSGSGAGAGTRLSEGEICHVLLAVTSAIGYLHAQQPPVAHRDIRPENILINNSQTGPAAYKLCNFGSATTEAYQCESREEASMAIADIEAHTNPAFRSPEMADPWSKRRICEKADMWSLGVLLYYMMYLKLPFNPTNMALSGNPKVSFPAGSEGRYTGALRVVVEHLLDPNPEKRWDVFALTNFLRFDEDVSRHLSTFCFTRTEWPEGWEEQDVKVLNREQPPKAPPVTYNGEAGHETAADHRRAQSKTTPRPTASSGLAATAATSNARSNDDVVREAMMVLGGDADDDDPEMAQYRAMIIREQEEAWELARKGRAATATSPSNQATSPTPEVSGQSQPPTPTPKPDVLDDLFGGTPSPTADASGYGSASNNGPSPPQQQQQQGGAAAAPKAADPFNAADLFGSAPPQQQQYGNSNYAPQQQQQQPAFGGFGGGWDTGAPPTMAPNAMGGGYNQQQQQPWGGAGGYPQQQQQPQQFQNYNNNGANSNFMAPPQQQQQATMNFVAPAPGQLPMASAPPAEATPVKPAAVRKDPFADLFS